MAGPLTGLVILEFAGIGPTPFCGMLLSDLGATVICIERPESTERLMSRGKSSIAIDLKHLEASEVALALVAKADALIEGYRPGVMERLGLGPEICLEVNPGLVYGRMTGWGGSGPLAGTAGHDIDYLAVSGALGAIGDEDRPSPPLNLVADFGGGAMFLAVGVLAALRSVAETGQGQVVEAAMVDGVAYMTTMLHEAMDAGWWTPKRRSNLLDGCAPFYDTYRCSDGEFVAVGALEPRFFAELVSGLGLADAGVQMDTTGWPVMRELFASVFATRTRDEWVEEFAGTDACVAPVMSPVEAPDHPHLRARGTFGDIGGVILPMPAPRFSATPTAKPLAPSPVGSGFRQILAWAGYHDPQVDTLIDTGPVWTGVNDDSRDRTT